MNAQYKSGIMFIAGSIATLIINDVYPPTRDYIVTKTIPSLSSLEPLMIVEIIAFCAMGFGVFLILKEKYGWFKKSNEQQKKQYDYTTSALIVEIKDKFWYPPEKHINSKWYTIKIKTLFRNFNQSTTIHTVSISFQYKGQLYDIPTNDLREIKMISGDSTNQDFNFNINEREIQIDTNPTNVKLKIEHTYDKVEPIIDEIPKLS